MNRSKLRNHHATSLTILKDTKRRKQNGLNPAQRYFPESRPIGIQCDLGSIHILNILFVENTVIGKFILFHVITSHIALPFPKTDTKFEPASRQERANVAPDLEKVENPRPRIHRGGFLSAEVCTNKNNNSSKEREFL
ncbi:uncharacterized protein LOC110835033 isoform X2 [Zootermopsis nevadensis]|uniref:uncharacterized protein LOC110835033 isoform X2 n=1 Tax=Zootermopsis nevadensis TaxID=136037 RepID=UPI000B8EBFBC|nr:uncharacterized protein LOC110835033 isoform X2 [Zootermopsis nevadensis]